MDREELEARLAASGLEGPDVEEALGDLQTLADTLAESPFPPDTRVEIFEAQFDALTAPPSIEAAFAALQAKLTDGDLEWFQTQEEEELSKLHFTLGAWIRSRWCAAPTSRLVHWFEARGISNAEDMSDLVLTSFHRSLNGRPINLDGQIEEIRAYWADAAEIPNEPETSKPSEDLTRTIESLGGIITTV